MTSQTINLDLIPKGVPPIIHASQYDKGQTWLFNILVNGEPYNIPQGCAVTIQGTKADNTGFQYACTFLGNVVTATETQQMTVLAGDVPAEIRLSQGEATELIGTLNFIIRVEPAALSDDTVISETDISMLEQAIELAEKVPEIIQECQEYVDETDANAKIAEKYATGKIEGVDVPSTDPAYHNNAKYYADAAGNSATNAATSEGNAATSESNAEAYATGTRNGQAVANDDPTYHNNAKYYSEQASTSAENAATSEGNASDSAQAASNDADAAHDDAILAESYTKGGTGTRAGEDTDNAKYYKEQAAQYAGSAVDFTGATATTDGSHGLVPKPLAGDQDKFLCGDGTFKQVAAGASSVSTLTDVNLNNVADGQILKYDSVSGKWVNANESGGGSTTLSGLTDVDFNNLTNGQLIQYNATTQKWVNIGIDSTPTQNSIKPVTSGGVYSALPKDMVGATAGANGTHGLVPQPLTTDKDKYLKGDGTWGTPSGGGGANGSIINISTSEITLANKTVTITCNGETTTATIDANGKAQIVGFTAIGTATISATDGNDTATTLLNIPFFGNYDVTLAFWSATLSITTDTVDLYGQTITIKNSNDVTIGTTTFDNTGSATYLVNKADTYTLSATYTGVTASSSVVVSSQTTYNVSLHLWTATLNLSTGSSDLYGQTITITDSNSLVVGTTSFSNSGSATFYVHKTDLFMCECTFGLDTYSTAVNVTAETTYNVSINIGFDFKQWLTLGGVSPTGYNAISEVFADEDVTRQLMLTHASADYLAECVAEQIDDLDVFTADDTAMKWLGQCDYLVDKLVAINGVEAKLLASQYWERYLKDHVPTMTANNAPYGEVVCSSSFGSGSEAYKSFDGVSNTQWRPSSGATNNNIGYLFTNPVKVKKVSITAESVGSTAPTSIDFKLQGYDGATWHDIESITLTGYSSTISTFSFDVSENSYYFGYRLFTSEPLFVNNQWGVYLDEVQFYGRSLNVSVPVMTSNTAPYGEVSSINNSSDAWKAYGSDQFGSISNQDNSWIQYEFTNSFVPLLGRNDFIGSSLDGNVVTCNISASDDGNTFEVISNNYQRTHNVQDASLFSINSQKKAFKYLRTNVVNRGNAGGLSFRGINFYGVDYSEREFEPNTNKKWLYDHGLELETLTTSGTVTKGDDYLTLSAANSEATASIDLTDYSLLRGKVGDHMSGTTQLSVGGSSPAAATMSSDYAPNNFSLDISSFNQSLATGVKMTVNGTADITELWVE